MVDKALVVEDEPTLLETLEHNLTRQSPTVEILR
jgi:DNA-binding response OmpR family regulator